MNGPKPRLAPGGVSKCAESTKSYAVMNHLGNWEPDAKRLPNLSEVLASLALVFRSILLHKKRLDGRSSS